jgi:hypothetical protein
MTNANTPTNLIKRDACIALLFGEADRPSRRTWEAWKARRMIPFVKLGGLCYYDPVAVREALAKKFTVNAAS